MSSFAKSVGCVLLAAVVASCVEGGPTERLSRTEFVIVGTVHSTFDDSPIAGANVSLERNGDGGCIPVMSAVETSPFHLARSAVTPTRAWGPVCWPIATASTDEDGSYEMRVDVEYEPGQCETGLRLEAWASGYQVGLGAGLECTTDPQTFDFTLEPATILPPQLFNPAPGFVVPQNQNVEGCPASTSAGSGYRIAFDWSDVLGTLSPPLYRIVMEQPGASQPLVDELVSSSDFAFVTCDFVRDSDRLGWYWRVRTETPEQISSWSELRPIEFVRCRLSGGVPCATPAASGVPRGAGA